MYSGSPGLEGKLASIKPSFLKSNSGMDMPDGRDNFPAVTGRSYFLIKNHITLGLMMAEPDVFEIEQIAIE
jgi:hypothetical protein